MSARIWYGDKLNDWAERWVAYWTHDQGTFAMSAEEDTGIMQALRFLAQNKRVDVDRVLILRAASDYTVAPPGVTAAAFLAREVKDGFPANQEALNALYALAAPIARELSQNWATTKGTIPRAGAENQALTQSGRR